MITVTSPSGPSGTLRIPVAHSNVSISGPKLSVVLYEGALDVAGQYSVQIPPGTLQEKSHHVADVAAHFTGLNGTSLQFRISTADVMAPTLEIVNQFPPHEPTPTYGLPETTSLRLLFNEIVQAGSGNITLVPKYTSPTLVIPAKAAIFKSGFVFASPPNGLVAGEVYSVKISQQAFKDTA